MTDVVRDDGEVVSFLDVATTLLRARWRILRWMIIGAVAGGIWALTRPPVYLGSASFVPQGNDTQRGGLAAIAGQFGVALPTGDQSVSPDFYARLLTSRDLLRPVAEDSFATAESGGRRVPFVDLFKIRGASPQARVENAVKYLASAVKVSVAKPTGIVDVSIATRWPGVSLTIVKQLIDGVNDFNLHTRQGQAAAERRFVESRLALAADSLRTAEDRMAGFLAANRQTSNSPELTFARDRLQRDLALQQQVYTTLAQSYEDLRMREVRDTPLITLVEAPAVPAEPEARGRIKLVLLGVVLGAFLACFIALTSETFARRRREGGPAADTFGVALAEVRDDVAALRPWTRRSVARSRE